MGPHIQRARGWRLISGGAFGLVTALALTFVLFSGLHATPAHAAVRKALINSSTVSGGTSSQEYRIAVAAGFTVDLVSDAAWGAMTQAQFGTYELLIAGDPTCGGLPSGLITSASRYGPVVMGHAGGRTQAGNRIVVGTDPVYHDGGNFGPGSRGTIIRDGINFAGIQTGRTGMYLDASCSGTQSVTILPFLSEGTGAWTINGGPPCGGNVSLIASHPAFSDLTTATLQGWGCSVHESYPTFPSDWSALAVATDTPSHPTCGVDPANGTSHCGEAYILVSGSAVVVVSGSIAVSPLDATNPVYTAHTVTAHVTSGGSPLAGATVTFTVTGQNAGATGACVPVGCVSDSNGDVSFTYHDTNGAGDDTIKASFHDAAGSLQAATAQKHWVAPVDPPIAATGRDLSATEGAAFSGPVATVTDPDSTATAADYTATIDWGDGSPVSPGTVTGPTGGPFTVSGTHTYIEEGTYTVHTHVVNTPTNTADANSTATVGDAALTAGAGVALSGMPGTAVGGALGTFTDANPFATTADFTAIIDWGDGSPTSAGTVTGAGSGPYTVSGSHTYATDASYGITIVVTDDGGATTTIHSTAEIIDPPISASGVNVSTTEGAAFSGPVATVTDPDPAATADEYSAVIDWGDASPPTAGTLSGPVGGPFTVSGSHTYAEEGTYTIHVKVSDIDNGLNNADATSTATVADAPLTAGSGAALSGVEGAPASGSVGTFTDGNPGATAGEFTATIDWGDGSPTSAGTVSGSGSGPYTVTGSHTYADEGTFAVKVTVKDVGGSTTTLNGTAKIADAPLTAGSGAALSGVEGTTVNGSVGTFTDGNPLATAADFTATIDWGDGSPTSAGTVAGSGSGPYTVSGSHLYKDEGTFTVKVTVKDLGGSTTTLTGTAKIADAPLAATGNPSLLTTNPVNNQVVATFTDANPYGPLSDFTATIDWGDGSPTSAGVISGPTGGPFTVRGTHTYATLGPKTVTVTIKDIGGSTATAKTNILLFAYTSGGTFTVGNGSASGSVYFWGSQWSKQNIVSGGEAPNAFKGFINGGGTPACGGTWTTDPGNSSNPPATIGDYIAVVVTSGVTKSGSNIAGNTVKIVIVKVNPGYAGNPGHEGTGTVVATLCG